MRDAARSGKKRWALGNWDLRWKVTAVLAVPLAVAVGLGVSRITSEFTEANRLAQVAENVTAIPAVTGLSANVATVVGSQMVSLMPGSSVVTDQNLTDLDKAIGEAEGAAGRLDGVGGARAALDSMINDAKAVQTQGKSPTLQYSDGLGVIDRVRNNSIRIVESAVGQVSDPGVDQAKLRLVDSLNTRATLVSELAGFAEVLRDRDAGVQSFLTGAAAERQLLNVLANRFPAGDTSIADLRAGIDTRTELLTGPAATAGQLPIGELKNSLTGSLDVYERVVARATRDIDTAMNSLASTANRDAFTYTGVVIATILAALLLAVFVARSMIVPLHRLRLAALRVAESDLPHEVAQLRTGAAPEDVPLEPMPIRSSEEIGQLARAVDDIHGQALRLASDQAQMRSQVNDMFETLARRSKSLVDHQLSLIEAMEYDEKDPRLLENLFRLDHLAARMRRNGDNLLILAGTKQRRAKSAPVEIADVLRAAISEVEDYERVKLGATPRGSLKEPAASDLAHLFAELLDNALRASPPETDVKFTFAQAHDQGLLIEVADRGIGMPPPEMAEINRRLEKTAEPGPDTARHMGLFVVGRLAERHGLTVRLRPTFDTARDPGVTVTVHVPVGLIVSGQAGVPKAAPAVPSPGQPQRPQPAAPAAPAPAAPMQTRSIQRTTGGNVMVTVDPGVSGPISAGAGGGTGAPPAAAGAGGGLPQRQPGNAMASASGQPGGASLRSSSEAAQAAQAAQAAGSGNTPQLGKLAAANLPKRTVGGAVPPRQPGTPQPAPGGTPPRAPGQNGTGGLPQRQPGANGAPATAGGGLPQRQPGVNGAPAGERPGDSAPPSGPVNLAGAPAEPRTERPGGLPQRQPGASGAPRPAPGISHPGTGSIPQRRPGAEPPREPASGLPPREPRESPLPAREVPLASRETGLPQRQPGADRGAPPQRDGLAGRETGLPQRGEPGSREGGLPQRGAPGLPQRGESGVPGREGGLPQRDGLVGRDTGLPQRESGLPQRGENGPPSRDGGLPQRGENGLPQRDGGLPQRGESGLPSRDGGLPQRGESGLPQRDGGLPQRDGGLPQRDGGLPQRDGGLPQRGESGLPQRGENGLPQRGENGLPQRGENGLPQRDGGLPQRGDNSLSQRGDGGPPQRDGGLPQRGDNGLPQRDGGLPQRGDGGLPQRDGGLPQRGENGLPQRDGGLPQRGENGLPQRDGGLPQRGDNSLSQRGEAGHPQRGENGLPGLPQRGENGLPTRQPGAQTPPGLPRRNPGAMVAPHEPPPPSVALPRRAPAGPASGAQPEVGAETGRHSRANPQRTASFFQSRLQPAPEGGVAAGGSPIFAEMMSAWLSDPDPDRSEVAAAFESPGDEGWLAARRASEAQAENRTAAGLPQRNPGVRLVPGAVSGQANRTPPRDPETIRSSLSRHQQGVRDGRAMRAMNLTGDKGDL
ncbi:ATP-binding protein [Nocardia sp. NPDC057227]|uniref:ATP-binding protein n=1 Tax=Nocardia sp. NPDC057227 TaxID=3346056 RepID=UPI00363DF0A7